MYDTLYPVYDIYYDHISFHMQDYENRIQSLQEQVERHSMISSVATTHIFDEDEEEEEGEVSNVSMLI